MKNYKTLIYDGSFNGFLTVIFKAFDENIAIADIQKNSRKQSGLFSDIETIHTNIENAKSVWRGIQTKSHLAIRNIYFAFLSEQAGIELQLYTYVKKLFSPADLLSLNFSNEIEARIIQLAKQVAKEKQQMESSIKFTETADAIQFVNIQPDNDILPLISRHYRFQLSNKPWVIYDSTRNYGLYYNLQSIELISLDSEVVNANTIISSLNVKPLIVRKLHRQPIQKQSTAYLQERTAV